MAPLLLLLLLFWPAIESSDKTFGKSYLIFESEGARSVITLQRSEHGKFGLKYLDVSIEHNVDDVPYQSILDQDVLEPGKEYTYNLATRTEELKFIVDFIDPCCKDQFVASIQYSKQKDFLYISYENCDQLVIPFQAMDLGDDCHTSTLQLGPHCSLFCACASLPSDGKCPSPELSPMVDCDENDHSFDTCDYNPVTGEYHSISFNWKFSMAVAQGTITSRIIDDQRAVAFNFIDDSSQSTVFTFDHVFGSTIDGSKQFIIPFEQSFVLTMNAGASKLALRFDISSQGEVSVLYKNCEQFKMSEKGDCYGGNDNGQFYFCEETGNVFTTYPLKTCANPTALKKYTELKVLFNDYSHSSTEEGTLNMEQSSDAPGILQATYTREVFSPYVSVYINTQIVSGQFQVYAERKSVIAIEMRDSTDSSIEGHVQLVFTEDSRIVTEVDGCNQFEIVSDQDEVQCRAQFITTIGLFCFCNRNLATQSDCQPLKNPIIIECSTEDPGLSTSAVPEIISSFEVKIFNSNSEFAYYRLSWEMDESMGFYRFQKESQFVEITGSTEFTTMDVVDGIIRESSFNVALGDRVTVSLTQGIGELFVLHFTPQLTGVQLIYRSCIIGEIKIASSTDMPCIIESSGGWNFSICPGGYTGNPQQFTHCPNPVQAQVFNFDLISELESLYLYVGSARMDLQVYWNEERPDYFDFKIKNYRSFGDVKLLINYAEYHDAQSAVFTIGTTVPVQFDVHGKELFRLDMNLNSPIVSVMARDCEQFKLTEDICRAEHTIFHSLKFCATSEHVLSQHISTCSGNTDDPLPPIPSEIPHTTYRMHFSYKSNSRSMSGFVSEEIQEEEGEIVERSLVFHWIDDAQLTPLPFSVSFTTMGKTIKETTPSSPYNIPFEVDSPVIFRILDPLSSPLFEFSILIGENDTSVIYDGCPQFSIDEPDGDCYGTTNSYLCSGEHGDENALQPFVTCHSTDAPSQTDLRAFFIYQSEQKIFTWDVMMSKNNDTGEWIVDASETGSNTMIGAVTWGNSAASTLTFTAPMGELTVFSVIDRQSHATLDSFSVLPSPQSVAVIYNDCTQFMMGEKDTVECYQLMDTRLCNGEPTEKKDDPPMKACNVIQFSLGSSTDYGIVSQQRRDNYEQEITIVPPRSLSNQLKITVDSEPTTSLYLVLSTLQLVIITLAPQQFFSLLSLDYSTTVLDDKYCRQFEMDDVDILNYCYSSTGGVKLCPQHETLYTNPFNECQYSIIYFTSFSLSGFNQLKITHFSPTAYSIIYSLLVGTWDYSESQFRARIGDKKMNSSIYYALHPDDSAQFTYLTIPSSFSIQLENGVKTAVSHEGCFQFYMEEQNGECFQDKQTQLCEDWAGGSHTNDYRECHSSLPPIEEKTTTEERLRTTIVEGMSSTVNEGEGTTESTKKTVPTIATTTILTTTTKLTTPTPTTFYASIVLKEGSIRIDKSVDYSTKEGKAVFVVTANFVSQTKYKLYVDTVEYPYGTSHQKVYHNVGETLNLTIASGTEDVMSVELEIHKLDCTVLELDDCPQLTLEENVDECLSSDLLCICASTALACPVNDDPIKTCQTSPAPSTARSTTQGAFDTTSFSESTTLTDSTTPPSLEWTTERSTTKPDPDWTKGTLPLSTSAPESMTTGLLFTSTPTLSTPSIENNTGTSTSTSTTTMTSSTSSSMTTITPKKSLDDLSDLANTTISIDNVSQVLEETNAIVEIGNEKMEGQHIYYVSQILYNSANVSGISQSDALLVLDTLDDCLGAPEQSFLDSAENHDQAPQKFLQTLPLLVVNSPSEKLFLNGQQLGFSSQKHACVDEQDSSVFGLADTHNGFIEFGDVKDGDQPKSSIEIPTEAVCGSSGTHSLFSIHRTTKLFLGGKSYRRLAVKSSWYGSNDADYSQSSQSKALPYSISEAIDDDDGVTTEEVLPEACSSQQSLLEDQPVLTATVLDTSDGQMRFVSRDEEKGGKMATVTIDLTDSLRPLHGSLSFSWWDDSSLSWSTTDHCQLRDGQWGGKVIADCYHLTDFTLIVDGTKNDPCVCDTALIIVGYIISAASICALFLVVFATIINRIPFVSRMKAFSFIRDDLFRNRFHSVDVLYTISLLFFYLIFTLFHDESVAGHSCVVFAVISYSLLFCTVLLTLFQSYRTIATFSPFPIIRRVLSFASHQIFVCTVSAGAPLLISSILAIVSNFFDRDDGFCWVRPDYITFAVVIPLSVLIINGIICTILVVIRLYQEQKSQLMTGKNHLKRRIISVLIMQFTLGMPWVLQYFTLYAPTATVFHYLFTIVNGSQGIVLLLLYLYRRDRRMMSMRRRRGAANVARGMQARQMGARQKSVEVEEDYYEDELDGKSTDGIVN